MNRNASRKGNLLGMCLVSMVVVTGVCAGKKPDSKPAGSHVEILSAIPRLDHIPPIVVIYGSGFGDTPAVLMSTGAGTSESLVVVSSSDTLIEAELTNTRPGTYTLSVALDPGNTGSKSDSVDLCIGVNTPIGSIIAWHKNLGTEANLPVGWVECNGQVLNDAGSPYDGQPIPNLNGTALFLRGGTQSGTTQVDSVASHSHGVHLLSDTEASHVHNAQTSVGNAGSHLHESCTAVAAAGSHSHDADTELAESGDHSHSATTTVSSAGSHSHSASTNVGTVGPHGHGADTSVDSAGGHVHSIRGVDSGGTGTNWTDIDTRAWGDRVNYGHTEGAGNHSHTASTAIAAGGSHTHSASTTVHAGGNHGHAATTGIAESGNHAHSASTTVQASGGHEHEASTYVDVAGEHTHDASTATEAAGAHEHEVNGATDSLGEEETRPVNMSVVWIMRVR